MCKPVKNPNVFNGESEPWESDRVIEQLTMIQKAGKSLSVPGEFITLV